MWREGENVTVRELQGLHRERRGLDPGRAEELFIANVQRLTEYGTHFFSAVSVSNIVSVLYYCFYYTIN